jgi:hypothetical protein
MNEAKPKEFDKDAFIAAVEKAIAAKAPRNLDEADKFAESGKAEEVQGEVRGQVGQGKAGSAEEIATTTAAPPDTSAAVSKKVVPLSGDRPPGTPGTPNPASAVPDKLPASATDLSAGPAQVEAQMSDAQVSEPQLKKSNEPAFTHALGEKKSAERHSATAPGQMRKHEATELRSTTVQAKRLGTVAMGAMGAQRVRTGQQVGTGKSGAKSRDEEKRAQVTTLLRGVFDTMKKDVEAILDGLDKLVDDEFARGEKLARDAFTAEHERKMEEYKDRRYSGVLGKGRWVRDLFAGLPAEADKIFDEARAGYIRQMRQVISDVATTIGAELNRAKRRIAQGRTELNTAVSRLPADLRSIGREAAAEFSDKFDELTQSVDDKGTALVDTLATKYTDALKSVDEEIAAEKEKNKGLVAKAVDAVKAVINTILELKRLLLAVLAKAGQAVLLILKDPIGFLGNLVRAVGAGLRQFLANIGTHLQQGIMSWLLGRTTEAGLQIPAKFDTQGIVTMLASLLGVTWSNIRARLTRRVPDQAVAAAETAVPLVAQVRKQGVAGMWEDLKTRVGDLRKDLIDKVIAYVTPTIIQAGIMWVLSLLNPASAFVRAVKLIIDIVTFIVTRARQIFEFVNAVLDAVIAIARGGSGGAPALIERALARSIPVLLGFLAAVLGIGGIAAKVKQIVQALTKPVNRAIDWVIDKIVGLVKRLWAKIKPKPKPKPKPKAKPKTGAAPRPKRRPGSRRRPRRKDRPDPRKKGPKKGPKKGRKKDETKQDAKRRELMEALHEAGRLAKRTGDQDEVQHGLSGIKTRHHLSGLTMSVRVQASEQLLFRFDGAINPRATFEQLAVNKYLHDAIKTYGNDPSKYPHLLFAIDDMPGATAGRVVPGLQTTLGLSAAQARKYAAEWVRMGLLTATRTSHGRTVYSFVPLPTPADLLVPEDHPEYGKWTAGSARVPIPSAEAKRLWYLIIEGLRDNKPDNFETVAATLMRSMRIRAGRGALWSRGEDLSDYARSLGYTTLEAQNFYRATQGLTLVNDWPTVRPVWVAFSRRYAGQLRNEIHIFMRRFATGSVLVDIELPAVAATVSAGATIELKFHAMEWGDDPSHILNDPVPGYWRELNARGRPLSKGAQLVQDQSAAAGAAAIAEQRFLDSQAAKRARGGP